MLNTHREVTTIYRANGATSRSMLDGRSLRVPRGPNRLTEGPDPVDWVLLREGARTLIKAIILISITLAVLT